MNWPVFRHRASAALRALPAALWCAVSGLPAALKEARRWLWVLLAVAALAAGWRIFVAAPRQASRLSEAAGETKTRIEEVKAAAARGDDAEVQRRHAEAIDRAEEMLKGDR